jgi:hypothetical protein
MGGAIQSLSSSSKTLVIRHVPKAMMGVPQWVILQLEEDDH